ncbi:MAG: GerAB/ArcD/ProY family transporter [Paenibacillus macerans]|nr:GerAB/ArcD/ProY family transporter [Paenibacillus macerans]
MLGRLAQLFLPVTIVVFALLSILTIPEWNVSNALPIMGNGPIPSLKGAIVPFTWFSGYLLLGLYFPLLSNQRKAAFFVLTAWFGEMITLAASGLVSVFLFGEYAGTLNYPFIEVVRYIGLGEFFQHIDALLLAVWLPGTFIELAAYFYAAVTGMAAWIGLKDYRALAFPLGFLALVVSFWGLSGAADFAHYLATSHVWFDFSLVVFGFILFLTAWIRGKLGALKPNRVQEKDGM